MEAIQVVLQFMDRINQHDVAKLLDSMTSDHAFVDSLGNAMHGRDAMRGAWSGYFKMCPDYWVTHEEIFADGNRVAVFGAAGGTIARDGQLSAENKWRISAAWLAIVEGDLVKQWRVYADNKPVYDLLAKQAK